MQSILRQARRSDVHDIMRVRLSVNENQLTSRVISDDEVIESIEVSGRGWVVEVDGRIVAFAIGNAQTGNIWALFVEPGHEGQGHGRRLQAEMIAWLWSQGLKRLWLSTSPGTRAERFYESTGWQRQGLTSDGEVLFEQRENVRSPRSPT